VEERARSVERTTSKGRRKTEPLPIEGIWVSSGWMGDAQAGALRLRICEEGPPDHPTCEEWTYDPARGRLGFVAVGYQWPENNWGTVRGKNLSSKGFTRLTFLAKGKRGGERLVCKSGGHTQPNAPFPASYERTCGVITLARHWKQFSISLQGCDTSNTPTAFVFAIDRRLCPRGCVVYLSAVTFCGPEE
jgi:hypothetical protein